MRVRSLIVNNGDASVMRRMRAVHPHRDACYVCIRLASFVRYAWASWIIDVVAPDHEWGIPLSSVALWGAC